MRGFNEEGTTTTPFDMAVLNGIDRFHLLIDVVERVPKLANKRAYIRDLAENKIMEHTNYIRQFGEDMPEIRNWKWQGKLEKES